MGRMADAAKTGSSSVVLEALRDTVSSAVYSRETPVRDFAALALRLHELLGDDREELRRLRDRVAEMLDATSTTKELAALSRRMQLLTSHLERLDAERDDEDGMSSAIGTEDESWDGDASDL